MVQLLSSVSNPSFPLAVDSDRQGSMMVANKNKISQLIKLIRLISVPPSLIYCSWPECHLTYPGKYYNTEGISFARGLALLDQEAP